MVSGIANSFPCHIQLLFQEPPDHTVFAIASSKTLFSVIELLVLDFRVNASYDPSIASRSSKSHSYDLRSSTARATKL